ncbi:MAG TPA: hypothetical protein VKE49_08385 [Myxococcaceae bacterium]|nr:hypothetical protein [Myxococcaceae bacterium]
MSTEESLEQLRRQVWQLRALAIFNAAAALSAVLAAILLRGNDQEVRARKFSLIDAAGKTRLEMSEFQKDRYGLAIVDSERRPRLALAIEPDGSPRLSMAAASGQALAELTVFHEAPRLALANAAGVDFFSLSLEMDGSSRLTLADQFGRPRAILGAGEDGSPSLVMADRNGRPRAELLVSAESSSLMLEGRNGAIFRAPVE